MNEQVQNSQTKVKKHPHLFGICLGNKLIEAHVLVYNQKTGHYGLTEIPSCQMPAMAAISPTGEILVGYRARNFWYAHKEAPVFYGLDLYNMDSEPTSISYKGMEFSIADICQQLFDEFSTYLDSFVGKGYKECFITLPSVKDSVGSIAVVSCLREAGFLPMGIVPAMRVALCTRVSNMAAKKNEEIPFALGYCIDHGEMLLSCIRFANGTAEEAFSGKLREKAAEKILAEFGSENPSQDFLALPDEEKASRILKVCRSFLSWEKDPLVLHFKNYEKFAARGALYHMMKQCGLRDSFPVMETIAVPAFEKDQSSIYEQKTSVWGPNEFHDFLYKALDLTSQKLNLLGSEEQTSPLAVGVMKILKQMGNLMKEERSNWQNPEGSGLSESILNKMLAVYDSMENGIRTMDAKTELKSAKILAELCISYRQAMESCGIQIIPAEGKKFDPNLHYAIMKEASSVIRDGYILDEYQKGFRYRGKMLRPSKVKVSID